jgi:hypothetical protein
MEGLSCQIEDHIPALNLGGQAWHAAQVVNDIRNPSDILRIAQAPGWSR